MNIFFQNAVCLLFFFLSFLSLQTELLTKLGHISGTSAHERCSINLHSDMQTTFNIQIYKLMKSKETALCSTLYTCICNNLTVVFILHYFNYF